MDYVLITAARNEDAIIATTIESVIAQTQLPLRWVIVDDGSTDRTADIVAGYARRYGWIELVRRKSRPNRSFAGKAAAVNAGFERLKEFGQQFEVVGNLDGDVSFPSDYMQFVMAKFATDARLGIAGTPFTQDGGYDSTRDSFEGENYVAGPCQLFRYAGFQEIGGYVANHAGGVDWIAVMTARMKGWRVRAFPEKRFHHHRPMGTAERGAVAAMFSYGQKDYYLGGSPIWQLFRTAYQCTKRPFVIGGTSLLVGYTWAWITGVPRAISPDLMRFHRAEQHRKLRTVLRSVVQRRKIDAFSVSAQAEHERSRDHA